MQRPALFLDRDGVIVEEIGYLSQPSQILLLDGAAEAIARVNRLAIPVVVVTNQAGVARGYFPPERVAEIHGRLDELLDEFGRSCRSLLFLSSSSRCRHPALSNGLRLSQAATRDDDPSRRRAWTRPGPLIPGRRQGQ